MKKLFYYYSSTNGCGVNQKYTQKPDISYFTLYKCENTIKFSIFFTYSATYWPKKTLRNKIPTYSAEISHTYKQAFTKVFTFIHLNEVTSSVFLRNEEACITFKAYKGIASLGQYTVIFPFTQWADMGNVSYLQNGRSGQQMNSTNLNNGQLTLALDYTNAPALPEKLKTEIILFDIYNQEYIVSVANSPE
ncbi:hypothetical protein [Emticicia sp. 17c]|uniref:hypothetical protein n=1 Tax=Emticicia sp. 17c TaxID=3127704 RepID=UPI00301D578A